MITDCRSLQMANSPMPTTTRRFAETPGMGANGPDATAASITGSPLVDGRRDPSQAVREAVQALRVRNEQVPARRHMALEHRDDPLLDHLVEVDHHVAAEHD